MPWTAAAIESSSAYRGIPRPEEGQGRRRQAVHCLRVVVGGIEEDPSLQTASSGTTTMDALLAAKNGQSASVEQGPPCPTSYWSLSSASTWSAAPAPCPTAITARADALRSFLSQSAQRTVSPTMRLKGCRVRHSAYFFDWIPEAHEVGGNTYSQGEEESEDAGAAARAGWGSAADWLPRVACCRGMLRLGECQAVARGSCTCVQ